ncbi:MAG TPA: metallophosphoesterase [Casimicrobiaceae bacterium]|nr:metallophosphoesterase [Casimicrobiaceae bacterium]
MTRVLQISDTHLSPGKRHFRGNWTPLRDWALRQEPDLIIHTGDLTVDGADTEDDMRDGATLMRSLCAPVLAVPGNHDVGEAANRHQPVNDERLARWRRHFGDDWWVRDVDNWRLVGLDAMLFGAGIEEEARQLQWLDGILASAKGRRIAWFMHRPLFIESPDEPDTGYWSVKPRERALLMERIRRHRVALVATGHLHKWRDVEVDGCRYVWCASSGFLVGPDNQPDIPGEKRLGAAVYEFEDSNVSVHHVDVPGLSIFWIDDVIHEVYPPRHAG